MLNKIRKKKGVEKMRELLRSYDDLGYSRERLDLAKMIWTIFSDDFVVGDKITWLGHDNVHGLMHGQEIVATDQEVKYKDDLNFMKKIDELDFEPYKNI